MKFLSLQGNRLRCVNAKLFANLKRLELLRLDNNHKKLHIDPQGFVGLHSLTSLHLEKSRLHGQLDPGTFSHCAHSIEYLYLHKNSLTSLCESSFTFMTSLIELNLECNHLERLESNIFKDLCNLKSLSLKSNLLELNENDYDGIERLFKNQILLQSLDLSENKISQLNPLLFKNLTSLKYLRLGGNLLTDVDAFKRVETSLSLCLEELGLENNMIENLEPYAFKCLSCLKTLSLSQNKLRRIKAFTFLSLESLSVLDLSKNHIENIESCSFSSLKNIKNLDLSYNYLSDLDTFTLQGLDGLAVLDLSHNK